jgi:hypothetical protein
MRPSGLGEFPVTSLSETKLFEKFAVPQAEIFIQGHYLSLRNIQTFSGVNIDLSGIIRSLDFLLLFDQAKRRREIKIRKIRFQCHYRILRCVHVARRLGMTINTLKSTSFRLQGDHEVAAKLNLKNLNGHQYKIII